MAKQDDLFHVLRSRGVRKGVAKRVATLDGSGRRAGAKGQKLARQTVDDLTAAADDIRRRVLRTDQRRSQATRKAANTRHRNATKRSARAKRAAQTRAKGARTRARATS